MRPTSGIGYNTTKNTILLPRAYHRIHIWLDPQILQLDSQTVTTWYHFASGLHLLTKVPLFMVRLSLQKSMDGNLVTVLPKSIGMCFTHTKKYSQMSHPAWIYPRTQSMSIVVSMWPLAPKKIAEQLQKVAALCISSKEQIIRWQKVWILFSSPLLLFFYKQEWNFQSPMSSPRIVDSQIELIRIINECTNDTC